MNKNEVGAPTNQEINEVVKLALEDFWSRVAKQFSQAKTGDLSPLMVAKLELAAEEAVTEWWNNNCKDVI